MTGFGYRGKSLIPNIPTTEELRRLYSDPYFPSNEELDARLAHADAIHTAIEGRRAFSFVDEGGTLVNAAALFEEAR